MSGFAINYGIYVTYEVQDDSICTVVSHNYKERKRFSVVEVLEKKNDWADYIRGVIVVLQHHKFDLRKGISAYIYGEIPTGGLSSSAAVIISFMNAICKANGYELTDEEIINACKFVNAHEFIEKLDDGYDTEVGESGNKLSNGQRQLISFARAIIANPKILVLDEATSSIDTETEVLIQEAMKTVMKNRTCLVVAHRLSTVVNSDLIIVMREGRVLESGTHQELLAMKGYYFNLYRNQFIQEKESQMVQNL